MPLCRRHGTEGTTHTSLGPPHVGPGPGPSKTKLQMEAALVQVAVYLDLITPPLAPCLDCGTVYSGMFIDFIKLACSYGVSHSPSSEQRQQGLVLHITTAPYRELQTNDLTPNARKGKAQDANIYYRVPSYEDVTVVPSRLYGKSTYLPY